MADNAEKIAEYNFKKRTPEEQRAIARMGGKRSGEVRSQRALFRKMLKAKIQDASILKELDKAGLGKSYNDAMIFNMVNMAVNAPDDLVAIKATDLILKAIGEDRPQEEINNDAILEHNSSIQEFSLKNNGEAPSRDIEDFE